MLDERKNKPTHQGVGFIGEGKYKPCANGKTTACYEYWTGMLRRCYSEEYKKKHPTYKECEVCEEWHNFQIFAKWFYKNYYEIEGQRMELDKDILNKGNKIYSPKTCVFVPQCINKLFTNRKRQRGTLPIGVSKHEGRYSASCSIGNSKKIHLGHHDTPIEAFIEYKYFKEQFIREMAHQYKRKIPNKLYKAMLEYEIEIKD